MLRTTLCLTAFITAASLFAARPEKAEGGKDAKHLAGQAEFFRGAIPTIRFEMSDEDIEALRKDARRYVEVRMSEGAQNYKGVAVKLKGASEDIHFAGRCVVFRPGRYPSFRALGVSEYISALRELSPALRINDNRYVPLPVVVTDAVAPVNAMQIESKLPASTPSP